MSHHQPSNDEGTDEGITKLAEGKHPLYEGAVAGGAGVSCLLSTDVALLWAIL